MELTAGLREKRGLKFSMVYSLHKLGHCHLHSWVRRASDCTSFGLLRLLAVVTLKMYSGKRHHKLWRCNGLWFESLDLLTERFAFISNCEP